MFREGSIDGAILRPLICHDDARGWVIELYRDDEILPDLRPAMAYVSETLPGVVRGPHEHREQTDYFAFVGPGDFELYLWDDREGSPTRGNRQKVTVGQSNRVLAVVPPGVVHAYRNCGEEPAWVFNCPNRLYAGEGRAEPVDEIRHEDQPDHGYKLD